MITVTARSSTATGNALCVGLLLATAQPTMAAAAAPNVASAVSSDVSLVVVPQALRTHVPMVELSGLAWAPTLDRYLVVVDDSIDTDDNERHGPFMLAMDRTGHLDAEIVPIEGVNSVDDAESLTAGPNGTFFLLTSHSPNRKGKVKKPRRQLLHLTLEGRRLHVTAALDLHADGDLGRLLKSVGLPEDTAVDVEALTFHHGALYFGFKAPLLPDGLALIARMDHAMEVFAKGKLSTNSLAAWGQVKLTVPSPEGALVSEGIADLHFTADGAMYLCANAPKGKPKDGGGALWRVSQPRGGRMDASLVRRFAGLKPEGVTTAPTGTALTVVFDRNSRDPVWTSVVLPAGPTTGAQPSMTRSPTNSPSPAPHPKPGS
jgi:hypothetical protein